MTAPMPPSPAPEPLSPLLLPEILPQVFAQLHTDTDLARAEQVCRLWHLCIRDNPHLWTLRSLLHIGSASLSSSSSSSRLVEATAVTPLKPDLPHLYLDEPTHKSVCKRSYQWNTLAAHLEKRHARLQLHPPASPAPASRKRTLSGRQRGPPAVAAKRIALADGLRIDDVPTSHPRVRPGLRLLGAKVNRPSFSPPGTSVRGLRVCDVVVLDDRTVFLAVRRPKIGRTVYGALDLQTGRFLVLHREPITRHGPDFSVTVADVTSAFEDPAHRVPWVAVPMVHQKALGFFDARRLFASAWAAWPLDGPPPTPDMRWPVPPSLVNDHAFFHVRGDRLLCQGGFTNPLVLLYALPSPTHLTVPPSLSSLSLNPTPPTPPTPPADEDPAHVVLARPKLLWTAKLHRDETAVQLHDRFVAVFADRGALTMLWAADGTRAFTVPMPRAHTPHMLLAVRLTRSHALIWQSDVLLDPSPAQLAVRPLQRPAGWAADAVDADIDIWDVGLPGPDPVDSFTITRDESAFVYVADRDMVVVDLEHPARHDEGGFYMRGRDLA
ncbi:hypothetical protein HDU96_004598 [Phlyctochytrium bullatum]|nr:hypothetical protein HDU96_004598 [Phlyctochytrium bullatum]